MRQKGDSLLTETLDTVFRIKYYSEEASGIYTTMLDSLHAFANENVTVEKIKINNYEIDLYSSNNFFDFEIVGEIGSIKIIFLDKEMLECEEIPTKKFSSCPVLIDKQIKKKITTECLSVLNADPLTYKEERCVRFLSWLRENVSRSDYYFLGIR
jgi:hypothetical protein